MVQSDEALDLVSLAQGLFEPVFREHRPVPGRIGSRLGYGFRRLTHECEMAS